MSPARGPFWAFYSAFFREIPIWCSKSSKCLSTTARLIELSTIWIMYVSSYYREPLEVAAWLYTAQGISDFFIISGWFPCWHASACSAIFSAKHSFANYVSTGCRKATYYTIYKDSVGVQPLPELALHAGQGGYLPPISKGPPSRPKKKRKEAGRASARRRVVCGWGNGLGHNNYTCVASIAPIPPAD